MNDTIWVAVIALIGTLITAGPAIYGAVQSRQANKAVNHRKKDEPKLIDLVVETHERIGTLEAAFLHHLVRDHGGGWKYDQPQEPGHHATDGRQGQPQARPGQDGPGQREVRP